MVLGKLTEVFENVTENKLIYTSIFSEYTNLIGTDVSHTYQSLYCYDVALNHFKSQSRFAAESFLEQRLMEKLEVRPHFILNPGHLSNVSSECRLLQYFSMDELCRQMQEHEGA